MDAEPDWRKAEASAEVAEQPEPPRSENADGLIRGRKKSFCFFSCEEPLFPRDFNNSDAAAQQNNPAPHCQVFLKHDGIPIEFPRLCKSFLAVWYWLYIIWQCITRRGTLHSCNIPDVTALSDATVYSDWAGEDLDLAWAPTVDAERSSVSPYTSLPNSRCIVRRRDGLAEGINMDSLLYLDICFTSRARAPVSHEYASSRPTLVFIHRSAYYRGIQPFLPPTYIETNDTLSWDSTKQVVKWYWQMVSGGFCNKDV
ncbi:hypothetical protein C8J57DRAFT_1240731 [Mycena rebaudengoi]|nr:hypothetical protein C8J57DRAFT_1240731 [Mycena rebaudengoi]